jgi:hypothetical protein
MREIPETNFIKHTMCWRIDVWRPPDDDAGERPPAGVARSAMFEKTGVTAIDLVSQHVTDNAGFKDRSIQ